MAENFPGFCVSFSLSALNDRLTGLSDKCSAPSELSISSFRCSRFAHLYFHMLLCHYFFVVFVSCRSTKMSVMIVSTDVSVTIVSTEVFMLDSACAS